MATGKLTDLVEDKRTLTHFKSYQYKESRSMPIKVVVAGGSGLVGTKLVNRLTASGNEVVVLTRGKNRVVSDSLRFAHWNIQSGELPEEELSNANAIINLTGRGIADKRLTSKFKEEVYKSRIESTRLLVTYLNSNKSICDTFVNASAIGFYGYDRGDEILNEDADPGNGYMAELCVAWEKEARKTESVRTVIVRIGIVFDREEGAYKSLKAPILLGLGSALASGQQYMSWIHIEDLVAALQYCITNKNIEGVLNATAPKPIRNKRLTGVVSDSLNKAILMPKVPGFVLKLVAGELANALIGSLNAHPQRLLEHNFIFAYPEIEGAVRNLNWNK